MDWVSEYRKRIDNWPNESADGSANSSGSKISILPRIKSKKKNSSNENKKNENAKNNRSSSYSELNIFEVNILSSGHRYRNLVFQGGSVKGVAYIGALRALSDNNIDLAGMSRFAGTSAGGII